MNKNFLLWGLALILGLNAQAQVDADAIKFAKSVNPANAKTHLSVLASDEFEGRETGKKGAWMAADYIKKQFQRFGLKGPVKDSKNSYFQPVGFFNKTFENTVLSVNGENKENLIDFFVFPNVADQYGFNIKTNTVIFAGYGISKSGYDEYAGIDVAGKVVMIFAIDQPPLAADSSQQNEISSKQAKIKFLLENKAAGVLLINTTVDLLSPQMKTYISNGLEYLKSDKSNSDKTIPIVNIGTKLANEILAKANTDLETVKKQIADTKRPASMLIDIPVSFSTKVKDTPLRAENVLGFLEGSDPKLKNEVLVLTGHYDHIGLNQDPNATDKVFNGADDDGSGTTGVLLIADAFTKAKKAGKGPKRSILFMTVVGEEKGLLGSEWYSEHPVFPLKNTIANLNIDMIGRTGELYLGTPDSANYVYSVGSNMLSSELAKIQQDINNAYTKIKLDFKYDEPNDPERIYYRSDHYNFAKHNIPIIFYYDGMLGKDYHGLGDEVHKINFDLLAKRAQLIYYIAWELANRPNRPVVDKNEKGISD